MADEVPCYGRRSLARLAFSVAAAELADRARAHVPTTSDSWLRPGELLDEARALVVAAEELMERALVFERESGTSWTVLGEVLGISKQGAQQKYGALVGDWESAIEKATQATTSGPIAVCVPGEGGDSPEEHARRLDAWVLRHAEQHNPPQGKRPVSEGLVRASVIEEASMLTRIARRTRSETDPAKRRVYLACKAVVLTRVWRANPADTDAAEAAEDAQRDLAASTEAAGPGPRKGLRLVRNASKPKQERKS